MSFWRYLASIAGSGKVEGPTPNEASGRHQGSNGSDRIAQDLRSSARSVCGWTGSYRNGRGLSETELAISMVGFMRWLAMADVLRDRSLSEFQAYLQASGATGRSAALDLIEAISHKASVIAAIRRVHLEFDPEQELDWGVRLAEHREWNECFTRGTVLGTRALVYSFCHSLGYAAGTRDGSFGETVQRSLPHIWITTRGWNAETLGPTAADELVG